MARSHPITLTISGAPAWFNAMADKTAMRIAGGASMPQAFQRGAMLQDVYNTLPQKPPGVSPAPGVVSFGGSVFDTTRNEYVMPAGGGHGDYFGNETYVIKVNAAIPAWERINSPTAAAIAGQSGTPNGPGQYPGDAGVNQFPCASHLYQNAVGGNGRHWIICLGGQAGPSGAGSSSSYFSFNRATNAWTRHGSAFTAGPSAGLGFGEQGTSVYDSIGNCIWHAMKGGGLPDFYPPLIKVDCATFAVTTYNIPPLEFDGQWMAVIPDSSSAGRTIVAGASGGSNQLRWLDPGNPGAGWQSSGISAAGSFFYGFLFGVHYHAPSNALLCWYNSGSSIRKITVPANPRSGTYTRVADVTASASQLAAEIPNSDDIYIQTRAQLVPNMGNGRSAMAIWLRPNQPMWIYKFPAGALT